MSIFKRGRIYWYEFFFAGPRIRQIARENGKFGGRPRKTGGQR